MRYLMKDYRHVGQRSIWSFLNDVYTSLFLPSDFQKLQLFSKYFFFPYWVLSIFSHILPVTVLMTIIFIIVLWQKYQNQRLTTMRLKTDLMNIFANGGFFRFCISSFFLCLIFFFLYIIVAISTWKLQV